MMILNHNLSKRLSQFIESITYQKDTISDEAVQRILPTGHSFIYFELDGQPRKTFDNESLEPKDTLTRAWVIGMHAKPVSISVPDNAETLVIKFRPEGAYPYFQRKCEYFANQVVPAEQVFGDEILELRDALTQTNTTEAKFELVENWLKKRFSNKNNPKPQLIEVVNILRTAHNYKKGIAKYPQSQNHLISQFKKYVGITPKTFLRIQRFNEILDKVKADGPMKSSVIAAQYGYTDLAFFVEEFKAFSGFDQDAFIDMEEVTDTKEKPKPAFMQDEEE